MHRTPSAYPTLLYALFQAALVPSPACKTRHQAAPAAHSHTSCTQLHPVGPTCCNQLVTPSRSRPLHPSGARASGSLLSCSPTCPQGPCPQTCGWYASRQQAAYPATPHRAPLRRQAGLAIARPLGCLRMPCLAVRPMTVPASALHALLGMQLRTFC